LKKPKKFTPEENKPSHSTKSSRNYKIIPTDIFIHEAKILAKKYPNIGKDFLALAKELKHDPLSGERIGDNIYKIRMAISDKGGGKSGGARVITYVKIIDEKVFVLSTYDKGEYDTVIKSVLQVRISKL